ncbi:hypothetical protein ACFLRH_03180 [Actinomycetota bacterium]
MRRSYPASLPRRIRKGEEGVALAVVIMGVLAIALATFLVQKLAISQTTQSNFYAGEDATLAAGEAMLDRYAAKLSIDPLYFQTYVDEAEAPRRCSDTGSPSYGTVVGPGTAWITDCSSWTYEFTSTYYQHPLLVGEAPAFDDVGVLMHVEPPSGAQRLTVEIVAKQADRPAQRSLQVEIGPEAASEFVWLVEGDLFFGPEDKTFGKVYSGGNVGYETGGEAHGNVYAEDAIVLDLKVKSKRYHPPIWMSGAQGWDSTGNFNLTGETILDVYPDPIDFDTFWEDLDELAAAACGGGGICLDPAVNPAIPSDVVAYLIETTSGGAQLQISYATETPKDNTCNIPLSESEEKLARFSQASQDAAWTLLGTFDIPGNGVLWASDLVIVGRDASAPFSLSGALTIYTGDSSSRNNIIIGSDIEYADGLNGDDLLALIASGEMWINPNAIGNDREMHIYGSLLNQDGTFHLSKRCLESGNCVSPPGTTITTYGSIAAIGTGNLAACVSADYNFDERLEILRPPYFPLVNDHWSFGNWREIPAPCWLESGGCP